METYTGEAGISRIVITDFKTDAVELDALKQRTAHYQPQMTAYAKAIAETYRIPLTRVECRLLFVSLDELVTLDVEGGSSA
jgi:ATP-dependent exoDNAse (exonuclease V) beta subunit